MIEIPDYHKTKRHLFHYAFILQFTSFHGSHSLILFFLAVFPFIFINFIRGFCVFISKLCIQIEIRASGGWTGSSHDYLLYALYHHSFAAWGRQNDFQDVFYGGKVAIYVERWRKYVAPAKCGFGEIMCGCKRKCEHISTAI